jgi:hypothetical protein
LLALLLVGLAAPAPALASSANSITVPFDHLTTGFELDGVHRDLPCESCHLNAVFRGTPRDCGTCHMKGSPYNATPKTMDHVPSSNNCGACHSTITFRPFVHFDHNEVLGGCVSCHNGTIAQGEGPTHPATSQQCAACHMVTTWNPPKTVDHTQIPLAVQGYCIVCHNGTQASGKPANHVVTTLECGDCHTTRTWLGANFDHAGITTGCYSCHNGTKAVGKSANHMPTSNVCESCHTTGIGTSTPSWAPSLFNHTQMAVNTCQTCHNGNVKISTGLVSGQPSNHVPPIPSAIDCGVCHGNNPSAETWTVLAASIPTLHSGLPVSNCLLCHAGESFAGVPSPYIPMSTSGVSPTHPTPLSPAHIPINAAAECSGCHAAAYLAGGFGPATAMSAAKHALVSTTCVTCHETGDSFYVGSGTPLQLRPADHLSSSDPRQASSDCSACHTTTDWNSTAMPAGHMPNPGNQACSVCHTSITTSYTVLATVAVLHTGISGNCGQCHGNYTTALTWFNNFTPKDAILAPNHIPYLSGTDCSSCHTANYVTGGYGPMNMTAAKHAFVPGACNTCHEAGLSFYMGGANPSLQGRPADHTTGQMVAPNDCSLCHTTANWNSTALPAGHMPNPANQACTVCHTNSPPDAALAPIATLHTGINSGCGLCHGGLSALTWYNNYTPKDGVLVPSHIPYNAGTDCSNCHTPNYASGGFGLMNMTSAKHTFVTTTCNTCHEAGLSFYMGSASPTLQGRPADHTSANQAAPNDCNLCHTTADWNSTVLPAGHMPNPAGQACSVCHKNVPPDSVLMPISNLHTAISSGCGQCHGGNTQLTFYNNNDNPLAAAALSPPHIPAFNGEDCSSCHTPNYKAGGFGPMNMTQATHSGVGSSCNPCHEAGLSFYMGLASPGLQGRPADHNSGQMVAPNDCKLCHTTANWNSTVMPAGHMPNPANQACSVCHKNVPPDSVLMPISNLHTGISSGCGQCHGGTSALTWYNNFTPKDGVLAPPHIPYLAGTDCSNCHAANYTAGGFGLMNMTQATHAYVVTTCVTCHEAGRSFYMGSASPALQGRPADHTQGQQVAPNDCSLCHTTANWNSNVMPAGHMPNPANQACSVCHLHSPPDATLATNAVLHTGISSGCLTCHGGPTGALTWYNNFTPKSAVLSPVHIPTSKTPCEDCHSPTTFTAFSGTTMSAAKHSLMFSYIGSTCDACHNKVTPALSFYGVSNLQTRPGDHSSGNKLTADCSQCHSPNNWGGGVQARVVASSRSSASTSTATAHAVAATTAAPLIAGARRDGPRAMGPGSIVLQARSAAAFSHTGIVGNCVGCHNGVTAIGKGPTHIASDQRCENCHTTLAWLPARFDHRSIAAVAPRCSSCHNAVQAVGKSINHVPTAADCSTCHGTLAWHPAQFSHSNVSGTCLSCHNGVIADGKTARHVATTLDCASCHSTSSWYARPTPATPAVRRSSGPVPPANRPRRDPDR